MSQWWFWVFALLWCFWPQYEEIEKIVEEVINILSHNQILSLGDDLVDMLSCVKQMEEFLDLDANLVSLIVQLNQHYQEQ